jgi:hypothetical protein
MHRARLALVALLLVAVPAATAGIPATNVAVGADEPVDATGSADRTLEAVDATGSSDVEPVGGVVSDDAGRRGSGGVADNRTPDRLELDADDVRTGYGTPGPDLSASVASGDGEFESGYGIHWYVYRIERAENVSERRRLIGETLDHVELRLQQLRDQEAEVIRSYHEGTTTTRALLGELARIDAEAATIRRSLDELSGYDALDRQLQVQIQDTQRGLESLEGPARKRIGAALNGEQTELVVHVTASSEGVIVEAVVGTEYVRETVRLDHYAPGSDGEPVDIEDRMLALYPDSFDPGQYRWGWSQTNEPQLYSVFFIPPSGSVNVYLDSETNQRYRERQTLRVSDLPTEAVASKTGGGITVTVDRVDGDNPVLVNVSAFGRSVDAIVRIDDRRVGRTGDDGELWTVGPPGEYTITVEGPSETVNVTVPGESDTDGPATVVGPGDSPGTRPEALDRRPGVYVRAGDQYGA